MHLEGIAGEATAKQTAGNEAQEAAWNVNSTRIVATQTSSYFFFVTFRCQPQSLQTHMSQPAMQWAEAHRHHWLAVLPMSLRGGMVNGEW